MRGRPVQEYLPLGPMSASEKAGLQALKPELLDSIKKGVDFVNKGTDNPSSTPTDSFLISRDDIPSGGSMVSVPPHLPEARAHVPQHTAVVRKGGGVAAAPTAAGPSRQADLPRSSSETTGELYAPQAGKGGGLAEEALDRFKVKGGHVKEGGDEAEAGKHGGGEAGEGQGAEEGKGPREKGSGNVQEGESGKVPSSAEETTGLLYSAQPLAEHGRYRGLAVGTPGLGEGHVQAASLAS